MPSHTKKTTLAKLKRTSTITRDELVTHLEALARELRRTSKNDKIIDTWERTEWALACAQEQLLKLGERQTLRQQREARCIVATAEVDKSG